MINDCSFLVPIIRIFSVHSINSALLPQAAGRPYSQLKHPRIAD
jgi:hypothetical protein